MDADPETIDDRLGQTLTAAGSGAFEWSAVSDEFRANPPLARILGIEGEPPGPPSACFRRLIVPEDVPGLLAAAEAARANGGGFRHARARPTARPRCSWWRSTTRPPCARR